MKIAGPFGAFFGAFVVSILDGSFKMERVPPVWSGGHGLLSRNFDRCCWRGKIARYPGYSRYAVRSRFLRGSVPCIAGNRTDLRRFRKSHSAGSNRHAALDSYSGIYNCLAAFLCLV